MNAGKVAARTALATLLLFFLVLICSAGAPALPSEFYGTVTVNGAPAPVGTILSAKINDAERGQYVLTEAGKYGGPGTFDQRLKIVAEESDVSGGNPKVTFWIDGQKAWQETTFQPGVSLNLDLSVGGEQPAVTNVPAGEKPIVSEEPEATGAVEPGVGSGSETVQVPSDMPPELPAESPADVPPVQEPGSPEVLPPVPPVPPVPPSGDLVADFAADVVSGSVPLTVQFTDLSTGNPTMWAWDFGDGTSDMVADPSHQYLLPGTYTVSLSVSNEQSTSVETKRAYITVTGEPGKLQADFIASPLTGKAPLTVQFTDRSAGAPVLYGWEFGDGTGDTVADPKHTYTKNGNYTVNLTIEDGAGQNSTKSKEGFILVEDVITPKPTLTPVAVPAVPETFIGTVEIYGRPIQAGGIVEARVPGYNVSGTFNPIKTAKGVFGKTGTFSPKLQVQGVPAESAIEFWVEDDETRMVRAHILADDGTYLWTLPYKPGQVQQVKLVVLETSPDEIPPIPVTPSPTTCAGVPSIPMSIQGDVHITNGTEFIDSDGACHYCGPNINTGGMVEARIEGYDVTGPQNPFTMVSKGYFGSGNSSWTDKLTIQGKCLPEDTNVTFWVKDEDWPSYTQAWILDSTNSTVNYSQINTSINATREIPYVGGTSQTVHLWAGDLPTYEVTPTPTPTPSAWEPQNFYGKAEFNGYPLRVGDRVMATREGVDLSNPTNPVTVKKFGEYGDLVGKEMLTVDVPYASMEQRDPISFWIKPQGFDNWYKAECKNPLSSADWNGTYPFTPGSITNVDLKSSDRAQFMYFNDIVEMISNVILPDDYIGW